MGKKIISSKETYFNRPNNPITLELYIVNKLKMKTKQLLIGLKQKLMMQDI